MALKRFSDRKYGVAAKTTGQLQKTIFDVCPAALRHRQQDGHHRVEALPGERAGERSLQADGAEDHRPLPPPAPVHPAHQGQGGGATGAQGGWLTQGRLG